MVAIPCTGQSKARGRNRWFHLAPAELTLCTHGPAAEARLCLDLYSRRRGQSAPVILVLTAADATAPALPVSQPCCPQCQAPQHLAYATP